MAAGLTQDELGKLIGRTQATVSRYESDIDVPDASALMALHVVFGVSLRRLFPAFHRRIEEAVMAQGAELDRLIRHRFDKASQNKRKLLQAMVGRARKAPRA